MECNLRSAVRTVAQIFRILHKQEIVDILNVFQMAPVANDQLTYNKWTFNSNLLI